MEHQFHMPQWSTYYIHPRYRSNQTVILETTIYTFKILMFALDGMQQIVGYAITRINFLCNVKKRNTKSYLPQFEQVLQ